MADRPSNHRQSRNSTRWQESQNYGGKRERLPSADGKSTARAIGRKTSARAWKLPETAPQGVQRRMVTLIGSIVGPRGNAAIVTAALLSHLGGIAAAQTGATLEGRITDASGAVVRQARIALVDEGTGVERRALSGSQGDYRFDFVPVGTYRLDVQAPGLRREVLPHLVVEVGRTIVQASTW